jgi:hypothetical protein
LGDEFCLVISTPGVTPKMEWHRKNTIHVFEFGPRRVFLGKKKTERFSQSLLSAVFKPQKTLTQTPFVNPRTSKP